LKEYDVEKVIKSDNRIVWAYPLAMIAAQLLPWEFSLALGAFFMIAGLVKSFKALLLFGFTILGHLCWFGVYSYLAANVTSAEWLKIIGRLGLFGYIALFALWGYFQPCSNHYMRLGSAKEQLKFPLIWQGFNEYLWRFTLIFCAICAAVAFFFFRSHLNASIILYGLLFASVNSILEEIIWRGLILGRVVDDIGEKQALMITSIAFGFYHLSLGFPIWICMAFAVGGFYMGGCAIKSKGLGLPILMHFFVNMVFVSLGMIF
jgi:membrane protease YdiL (CAAX protease family)